MTIVCIDLFDHKRDYQRKLIRMQNRSQKSYHHSNMLKVNKGQKIHLSKYFLWFQLVETSKYDEYRTDQNISCVVTGRFHESPVCMFCVLDLLKRVCISSTMRFKYNTITNATISSDFICYFQFQRYNNKHKYFN